MRLTRRYRFSAAHRLHTPLLSEAENRELYGKCNHPYGHGHDYVLEVTVQGPVDAVSGRVTRVEDLDRLVRMEVLEPFDRANLNAQLPAGRVPTTEHVAEEILNRLRRRWAEFFPASAPSLDGIRLYETRRNIFEISSSEYED
jgi:6-pyruvoyltetrahydropterin/6-carboxytetrahydropterin synthase